VTWQSVIALTEDGGGNTETYIENGIMDTKETEVGRRNKEIEDGAWRSRVEKGA
jgi:hypothetical protein